MLKKHITIIFLLLISTLTFAEDLQCTIRYFNKTIYYPNKSIPIKILIQNNSATAKTFDIADQRIYNVDFIVETLKKESLPHQEKFIIARNTNQPVYIREVRLEPGDEYNFIVDLASYIKIEEPGLYNVRVNFNTDINTGKNINNISSNSLILSVNSGSPEDIKEELAKEITTETLKEEQLSPDQVVDYTISARSKSEWNKFFLYLDLKELFLNNEDRNRKYRRATESEQITLLNNFKENIINGDVESGIISIPYSYEITNTTYTSKDAEVVVYTKFQYPDYSETKKYIYQLEKKDLVWYITSYEVLNLGTE